MSNSISIKTKKECCRMRADGLNSREIYDKYFSKMSGSSASYETFRTMLQKWAKQTFPDEVTLECGTYDGFTAHNATVQVSKNGEIIQAWIRQNANSFDLNDVVDSLRKSVEPYKYIPSYDKNANRMLEIPLFDMHWGISFMEDYEPVLNEIIDLIYSRHWDRIIIPFGQDFLHNDSIVHGVTSNNTAIEKVDMVRAVKEGRQFIVAIIDAALEQSNETRVIYTPGNHDRSITWMLIQVLLERYGPNVVDDTIDYRKVFTYGKNAIMVTHGNTKRATAKNLAHIFAISFPEEFAHANIREIHSGHLHHEQELDIFGVMVRRLSTGVSIDDWSNREDYIGSHRRFMLFEWDKDSLRSIHYI